MVTTAVYWGLVPELAPNLLTPSPNLPAPGRRQSVYIVCNFARTCVFSKQSFGPGLCGIQGFRASGGHGSPFLPKLRGYFAEFLNHVL